MVTGTAAARAKISPSAKAEKDSDTRASAWNNQRCTKIILATYYQNADLPATVKIIPSGLWCNSSISPCEGDGPGANPGFLTNEYKPNDGPGAAASLPAVRICR